MWAYSQWWHCVNSNIERLMIWKLISSQFEFWMHRKLGHLEGERTGTLCVGGIWGTFFFYLCGTGCLLWHCLDMTLDFLCGLYYGWQWQWQLCTCFASWHMRGTYFPLWHLCVTLTFLYDTCMTLTFFYDTYAWRSLSVMTHAWPHFPLWHMHDLTFLYDNYAWHSLFFMALFMCPSC